MRRIYFLSLLFATAAARAQVVYTIQDLGTLGGTISAGTSLNDFGQVAGSAYLTDNQVQNPFITDANGGLPLRGLGTLGGAQGYGQAINAGGQVAGTSFIEGDPNSPVAHAFLSGVDGGALLDLGTLGGLHSYAYGVNGAGRVAGYSSLPGNLNHAFVSDPNGGPLKDLGTLPGGAQSFAAAVNASGQVTGYSNTVDEFQAVVNHAFISDADGGPLHDLGTLGGSTSFGISINDNGQVAGRSYLSSGEQHAFRSGPNGGPLFDLGSLGRSSIAYGINNAGLVVGYSILSDNATPHAFLYRTNFGMLDLNHLIATDSGWVLNNASAINNLDQITGEGVINGETHAFLLNPIPPSARITTFGRGQTGNFVVLAKGTAYLTFTVEISTNLTAGFTPVGSALAGADGVLRYEDAIGSGDQRRFYRFVYP